MTWLQLTLHSDRDSAPGLEQALEEMGALAVTLRDGADEPIFEPELGEAPLWSHTQITGLFGAETDGKALLEALAATTGAPLPPHELCELEDQNWTRVWLKDFKPTRFGEKLWIVPSGYEPPQPDAVNIRLDPGLAFGTGTHPTTALCLQWLDAHPPVGLDVIDYGCGSGILAIAAAKLGARQVEATDIDPQALRATEENAQENQVAAVIKPSLAQNFNGKPADLMLANILANPLIELAPTLAALVRPGGSLVLSGILAQQAQSVAAAYGDYFLMAPPLEQDGWVLLHGERLPGHNETDKSVN